MTTEPPENITWGFYGIQFLNDNRPVQEWYDDLSDTERDEILDTLAHLQVLPNHLWEKPQYYPLGEGLSEVRCKDNVLNKTIRIYGFFHPSDRRHSYTFLLGKEKKVKNDQAGMKEAKSRMRKIEREEATIHVFKFST